MEYLWIYLIGQADTLKCALGAIAFIILLFLVPIVLAIKDRDWDIPKAIIMAIIGAVIMGFIAICIPSTKTAIAMAVIPPVINNEQVQKLPDNVLGFINEYLEHERLFRGSESL